MYVSRFEKTNFIRLFKHLAMIMAYRIILSTFKYQNVKYDLDAPKAL